MLQSMLNRKVGNTTSKSTNNSQQKRSELTGKCRHKNKFKLSANKLPT